MNIDNFKEIKIPTQINNLSTHELNELASNIRKYLIYQISETGGHIGANLGTIELTIALHSVFDSPKEPMLFDTGHIGYTHKLLTGRKDLFDSLNTYGGMNRFLTPQESSHDIIEASHAGTAISIGLGIALARKLDNNPDHVIAVVGDSAMAEGSSWEALNHAIVEKTNLITIINDNNFAISPGFGGMHNMFSSGSDKTKFFFESLGMNYIGEVDGHNIEEIISALNDAKNSDLPPIIHLKTVKGKGWLPADNHPFRMHFSFPYDPIDGSLKDKTPPSLTYPDVAGTCVNNLMDQNEKIVCITPSTLYATGMTNVFAKFPDRCFDPGMEEQHALSMTVGFALQGYLPIIAYQSTFLQRAFDQLLHDVCFSNLPTIILSMRSGFSGYDNPTHHGLYDISYMQSLPNLNVFYPKDGVELDAMINKLAINAKGPNLIMMPYGPLDHFENSKDIDNVLQPELSLEGKDMLIITVGNKYGVAKEVAEHLGAGLINLRCLLPLPKDQILELSKSYSKIVTIEEAVLDGGIGSSISALFSDNLQLKEVLRIGLPRKFIEPGSNDELCSIYGLDRPGVLKRIEDFWK